MQAGYDYMLVRNQLQHRLFKVIGLALLILGVLMLAGGGAYYAYAAKARAGLDDLVVTVPGDVVNVPDQGEGMVVSPAEMEATGIPHEITGPSQGEGSLWDSTSPASVISPVASAANSSAQPMVLESPPLRIPPSAIASQRLYPGESLQANSWSNPLVYEPPSYVEQSLLRNFTPLHLSQALPVGSQARPTRIIVPAIGVDSSVTALKILDLGDSRAYETPNRTVGHIPESASPGEAGSAWFFGHLESPIMREGAVFNNLPRIPGLLRKGEEVYIITDNGVHQYLYRITSTQVVHQNDMRLYDTGQATIHLVACVPALVYDHRLIATGQLIGIK
jgi:LPXTG-site transpeptidase (sortase) family protein